LGSICECLASCTRAVCSTIAEALRCLVDSLVSPLCRAAAACATGAYNSVLRPTGRALYAAGVAVGTAIAVVARAVGRALAAIGGAMAAVAVAVGGAIATIGRAIGAALSALVR
jgi:hypothetical protein